MRRTIIVSTRGTHLYKKQNLLHVERDGETLETIPFEDIEVVVLDSAGISVSTGVLAALAEGSSTVLVTGANHHPDGLFFPITANTLSSRRLRSQVNASDPLNKNLWKEIVRAKILCQAALIRGTETESKLRVLAGKVGSGDRPNLEAQASRLYWPALLGSSFLRRREGPSPNNFLNYGYAVLRASVARAVCAAGLNPSLGIHHENKYNAFCLADDLMEPYRPWIDRAAKSLRDKGETELTPQTKPVLANAMYDRVGLGTQTTTLLPAIQKTAASLAGCLEAAEEGGAASALAKELALPKPFQNQP